MSASTSAGGLLQPLSRLAAFGMSPAISAVAFARAAGASALAQS